MMPVRYTSRPFPAYAHRPGVTPHPITDPRGHSFGLTHPAPATRVPERPDDWSRCQPFRYGLDLHNHGYWWEAHEEWEVLWRAAPAESAEGALLQAMIQSCALWLKLAAGEREGCRRLLARIAALVARLPRGGTVLGIDVGVWWQAARGEGERCLGVPAPAPPLRPVPPAIRLPR